MRKVGSDPQCNNWQRGNCRGSDQEQEQDDFTAEELPYRRVRLAHMHMLLLQTMAHFHLRFFSAFWSCRRLIKGV
jgi:hypothetical protein